MSVPRYTDGTQRRSKTYIVIDASRNITFQQNVLLLNVGPKFKYSVFVIVIDETMT